MRGFLPDATGNQMRALQPGEGEQISASFHMGDGKIYEDQIVMIAFVQDMETREIYQVARLNYQPADDDDNNVSVPLLSNLQLKIFPNPSDGNIYLNLEGNGKQKVDIFDLNGRVIYSTLIETAQDGRVLLNLGHLSAGIFILRLNNGNEILQQKISIIK
jgi:hypothetical protein